MKTSTPEGWKKTFAQTLRDDGALLLDEDDARLNSAGASLIAAAHKIESLSAQLAKADAELARTIRAGAEEPPQIGVASAVVASAAAKCRHEFGEDGVCKKCGAKRSRAPRAAQQPLPTGGES